MNPEFSFKLRRIFLPYAIFTVSAIALYSLLNLYDYDDEFPVFTDTTVDHYFPFLFTLILSPIFIFRRFKLLDLNPKNNPRLEPYAPIFLASVVTIGFSIVTAQNYLRDTYGKFVHLQHIDDIQNTQNRFYTVGNFYVKKSHPRTILRTYTTGKHSEHLNFDYYFLLPLYNTVTDTNQTCKAWLGWIYSEEQNNRGDAYQDSVEKDFVQRASVIYEKQTFRNFPYLIRIGNTDERVRFRDIIPFGLPKDKMPILVMADEPYKQKRNMDLLKFLGAFIITLALPFGIILCNDLKEDAMIDEDRYTSLFSSPE
ncbi:hypothetical protein [Taibaiella soli]|uniref:Uncharacterized protein n=1 Tax=Taibaiella soli TaxID=1649169 RepID=A0A2W2AJH0_9BACT|nr:hypothetical protein [Taibaiella soli]PZF73662.1 hypothetical protein DN068_06600 [Taibaiella soli]